jgi:hypothetical protein
MAAQGSDNSMPSGNFGSRGGGRAAGFNPGFHPGFNSGFGGRGRGHDFFPSRGRGCRHGGYGSFGYNGNNYNGGYQGRDCRPYGGGYGGGRGHGSWPNSGWPHHQSIAAPGYQGGHPPPPNPVAF